MALKAKNGPNDWHAPSPSLRGAQAGAPGRSEGLGAAFDSIPDNRPNAPRNHRPKQFAVSAENRGSMRVPAAQQRPPV